MVHYRSDRDKHPHNYSVLYRMILIKLFLDVGVGGFLLIMLFKILIYHLEVLREISNGNSGTHEIVVTEEEKAATMKLFQSGHLVDALLWMIARGIYMLSVIIAAFAILLKHSSYLAVHLLMTIPNIALDFYLGMKTEFRDVVVKCLVLVMVGWDFYNILVIKFVHHEITKSKSLHYFDMKPRGVESQTQMSRRSSHCPTCICHLTPAYWNKSIPTSRKQSMAAQYARNEDVEDSLFEDTPLMIQGQLSSGKSSKSSSRENLLKPCESLLLTDAQHSLCSSDSRNASNTSDKPTTLARRITKTSIDKRRKDVDITVSYVNS